MYHIKHINSDTRMIRDVYPSDIVLDKRVFIKIKKTQVPV